MTDRAVQRLAVLREQLAANSVNMQETAAGQSVWQDVPQVFHDFRVKSRMPCELAQGVLPSLSMQCPGI
jgi:hypothetical protein